MATGPDDAGDKATDGISQEAPTRPEAVPRSISWPDSANMVAQQGAANRMFQQNSARLQQAAEAKREAQTQEQPASDELTFVKDRGRSNYAELKQEHAKLIDQNRDSDQTQGREPPEDELTFVKDGPRGNETSKDRDQGAGDGLTFVKDQNHDRGHGR